jgi:uncharacterized delta-60 repeat protein
LQKINTPLSQLTKRLVHRLALTLMTVAGLVTVASAQYGALDPNFGTGGIVLREISTADDQILAIAVQTDGRIVAAGYSEKPATFTVSRFFTDGSADTTFGTNGVVKTQFGKSSIIYAIAIQSDGKIVVAGDVGAGFGFALARYTPSGQLDATFGTQGKIETSNQGLSAASSLVIQSDGKIIAAGHTQTGDFATVRFTESGAFDLTFGEGDGIVTTDFYAEDDRAASVRLQSDGKIVAGGVATNLDLYPEFALARYLVDGTLDTSFGADASGKVTMFIECGVDAPGCGIEALGIQADGKIVAAGSNEDVHLARYNTDGSLSGAVITTDIGGFDDDLDSLVVDYGGGVLIAGSTNIAGNVDFFAARYQADGGLDPMFGGGDGVVSTSLGSNSDLAHAIAIQPNGGIIVGGSQGEFGAKQFGIVRYLGLAPTAAGVTLAGRVTTSYGSGIRSATVTLMDAYGTSRTAITNTFGYYSFSDVEVGNTYILTVSARRYTFTENTLVINLYDEYLDANFVADGV